MAARYLIGTGNRNWNDTANWSATSGGVGGASVPTINDDVYFDSNSGTGTVTVNTTANMRDCTFAQTQLITLANAAYPFNIYGNWTLCSNTYLNTSFTGTGYVYLKATTSVNITSNGCTRAWNRLYFDGVGGTWTNQDDFYINPSTPYLKNGHWNTNSKSINTSGLAIDAGVKMLTLGNSIFNGNAGAMFFHFNTSGMTLNAGTSTIINNNTAGGTGFYGGPFTFYNVIVSTYTQGSISGSSIFNNLTINNSPSGDGIVITHEGGTITINNNFTINGYNSSTRRLLITSNIIGKPRTIICNGTITASNVDFRDIVGDGTANWDLSAIEGGSGDCGGNSGIVFTPAQTQYFKHSLGAVNWSDATKWFSNYERTIAGRVPLPQDDAIFDESSFTGASTLNVNVPRICRSLNMEEVSHAVTFSLVSSIECYGDFVFGSNITHSGYYMKTLLGVGDFVINLYSKALVGYFQILRGSYTLLSDIDLIAEATNQLTVYNTASLNLNGFNLSAILIRFNTIGVINLGTGVLRLVSDNSTWAGYIEVSSSTNLIASDSTIILNTNQNPTNDHPRIIAPNKTIGKLLISGNTLKGQVIIDNMTIGELVIDAGRKLQITNGKTVTVSKLTAIGTPEQPITIGSTTAGQRHTINYTGSEASTVEYCNISDSKVTQARRLLAKNSVNAGNNQNWGFEELPPLALNFGQVDKMYVGGSEVVSAYYGEVKIK